MGGTEPDIAPQGDDRIFVQIPGLDPKAIEDTKKNLQKVALLELSSVLPGGADKIARIEAGQEILPPGYVIKTMKITRDDGTDINEKILVKRHPELSGEHVVRAGAYYETQGYGVNFKLDDEGSKIFAAMTEAAAPTHGQIAILLDGEVKSAPTVNSAIYGGSAQITGHFSEKEARDLASSLENPLRVPVEIVETRSVSATLGADSIRSGIMASLTGLVMVAAFMILYYRFVGLIAIIALLVNCTMVLGAMGMFNSVLTLPGIAGLILGLGIAVDANVLIYERLREEIDAGKSLRVAVNASYTRAFSAIFDAHVTQLLTAGILYGLATGPVKGFALTLTIGIIASMFSSLLVTYTCFDWAFHFKAIKKISMLHLIKAKRFDFLGNSKPFVLASIVLAIISIAVVGFRGQGMLDADFKGGDLLTFSFKGTVTPEQVRNALNDSGLGKSVIQSQSVNNRQLISIRSDFGTAEKIETILGQKLGGAELKFEQIDHIGPVFGAELARKSALALALGLVGNLYLCDDPLRDLVRVRLAHRPCA